jgi:hypothetical protein
MSLFQWLKDFFWRREALYATGLLILLITVVFQLSLYRQAVSSRS